MHCMSAFAFTLWIAHIEWVRSCCLSRQVPHSIFFFFVPPMSPTRMSHVMLVSRQIPHDKRRRHDKKLEIVSFFVGSPTFAHVTYTNESYPAKVKSLTNVARDSFRKNRNMRTNSNFCVFFLCHLPKILSCRLHERVIPWKSPPQHVARDSFTHFFLFFSYRIHFSHVACIFSMSCQNQIPHNMSLVTHSHVQHTPSCTRRD